MSWVRTVWLAVCFFAFSLSPLARADVVVLDNGDRITGAVEELADSKLTVATEYAGKVKIDWTRVARLESSANFEVEVESGRRYIGAVEREQDQLEILRDDEVYPVPSVTVVRMQEVQADETVGFWRRLDGGVDLGYSVTRGNSELTQASLGVSGNYRQEKYRLQGALSSIFSEQDESRATSRHALDGRYDRFLSPKSFAFALAGVERNDRASLDLRTKFGGGLGWNAIKGRRTQFSVLGGFTLTSEKFRVMDDGTRPVRNSGEALGGVEFRTVRWYDIEFTFNSSLHPNLVQTGRYRLESDAGIRVPLFGGFKWSISAFDRFDSRPPVDVKRNDYGIVSALGYAF